MAPDKVRKLTVVRKLLGEKSCPENQSQTENCCFGDVFLWLVSITLLCLIAVVFYHCAISMHGIIIHDVVASAAQMVRDICSTYSAWLSSNHGTWCFVLISLHVNCMTSLDIFVYLGFFQ